MVLAESSANCKIICQAFAMVHQHWIHPFSPLILVVKCCLCSLVLVDRHSKCMIYFCDTSFFALRQPCELECCSCCFTWFTTIGILFLVLCSVPIFTFITTALGDRRPPPRQSRSRSGLEIWMTYKIYWGLTGWRSHFW